MFARLARKAEQREKYECASNMLPAKHLDVHRPLRVIPPNKSCDLYDLGRVAMHASPAPPRYDTRLRIGHDVIRPQRNGPEYLDGGDSHQTEVLATIGTGS